MFIKPRSGLKIRDPETQCHIPPEGAEVSASIFWLRRIQDGDASIVTDTAQPTSTTESPSPIVKTTTTKKGSKIV